ncbi:MAG: NADH-quinone oxidoreductase subunit C [Planctomycetales bacterium]|nr:NADH-quinone oxidoreductase subunit C [Planctomycetales bacterium]
MTAQPSTIQALTARFTNLAVSEFRGQSRIALPSSELLSALQFLKDELEFDYLVDITCVDYLQYRGAEHRFGLAYLIANSESSERLTIRVMLDEPDLKVPSIVSLWEGANWMEREVWDMYGIRFEGHPNLKRILLPEEFSAHPLRKDYPLQGRGERHNFPVITRGEA